MDASPGAQFPTHSARAAVGTLFDEAIALQNAGQMAEAGNRYLRILAAHPEHPQALHMLGVVLFATDQLERGLHILHRAQAVQPETAELHNNLGATLHQLGRLDEAMLHFDRAVALGPEFAFAWSNRALALHQMRRLEEAVASFDKALELKPDAVDLRWHRSYARLQMGDYAEGWVDYEWRRHSAVGHLPGTEGPRWTGAEPIAGRVVLLHGEQGLGDTLQFCRYAPLVAARGAQVILAVSKPLVRLLQSLPVVTVMDIAGPLSPFDLQCPLMSLPLIFGTEVDTIPADSPYLMADPAEIATWRERLDMLPGRKVGLVWSGGTRPELAQSNRIDQRRSMRLAQLAPLATVPGVSFVSLQKGPPAAQALTPPDGLTLHDWTAELGDFADSAALVSGLDLLITVDTAMAHAGGALGVPTWVLNRHDTCWRWLNARDDTPWYPGMRLFTQRRPGDWDDVVDRVRIALHSESV